MTEEIQSVLWLMGWLLAFGILCCFGFRAALRPLCADRLRPIKLVLFAAIISVSAVLAHLAVTNHDIHFDTTANKALTADQATRELIDSLRQNVSITYFGHEADPRARRLMTILRTLARRSTFLQVRTTDPDKDPVLARRYNVSLYNVAVVEAGGRRLLVRSTNEVDVALAIQKALRQKVVSVCFVEGHGEAEIHNEEFHTHIESFGGSSPADGHQHGHAHIPVVQSTAHGIGRLRKSLEAMGYEARMINLTTESAALPSCNVVSIVQPKFAYTASEVASLRDYHRSGTAILFFIDIGYELGELARFFTEQGVEIEKTILVDEQQHHETDVESIAIAAYPEHPITKQIAMTIFPGARTLAIERSEVGLTRLVSANKSSQKVFLDELQSNGERPKPRPARSDGSAEPPIIALAKRENENNGKLIVFGDADFLTNSYFPYLSNNALALALYRWAVGESEAVAVAPPVAVFERIILTRGDMNLLFGGLVIGLPSLVLLIGGVVWFR